MPTTNEETTTAAEPTTIKEAVAAASAEAEKGLDGSTSNEEKPVESKEKKEAKTPDGPTEEEKLEAEEAIKLFRALKDPESRDTVIELLAKKGGYTKAPPETKAEVKEAKKNLVGRLKESLGTEFEFLADKFAGPIEEFLNEQREEGLKEIKEKFAQDELEKVQTQVGSAISKVATDFFGEGAEIPADVQKEMSKFMDKFPISAELTPKEYITDVFQFAVSKLGITKVDKKKEERTKANRSDVGGRLTSASDRGVSTNNRVVEDPSKTLTMTRRQAIQAAMDEISQDK